MLQAALSALVLAEMVMSFECLVPRLAGVAFLAIGAWLLVHDSRAR